MKTKNIQNIYRKIGISEEEENLMDMVASIRGNFLKFINMVNKESPKISKLSQGQIDNLFWTFAAQLEECDDEQIKKLYEATFFKSEGK